MMENVKDKVWRVASSALKERNCVSDIVLVINEFTIIMLSCRKNDVHVEMEIVENLIEMQLESLTELGETEIASLLYLIIEFIQEFKSELSVKFIQMLLCHDGILVTTVIFNNDKRVKHGLIKVYHDILALKNVQALQAAYKCIIDHFGVCLMKIPALNDTPWISKVIKFILIHNSLLNLINANL